MSHTGRKFLEYTTIAVITAVVVASLTADVISLEITTPRFAE